MIMIKGVDIGSFATKDNLGNIFESKVSGVGNILGNKYEVVLNDEVYYIGEGTFDTEYRKVNRVTYIKLLFGMLCLGTTDTQTQIDLVLGLPISQYKEDKEELKELIKENYHLQGSLNGTRRDIYISDCEVYPEGIAAIESSFEGIIVDIGGRTTDCCLTYENDGKRKIDKPISLPLGTLNLYSDFINLINSKYGLDFMINDAERIIKKGLTIEGNKIDLIFAVVVFKQYLENLIRQLNIEYNLKTNRISFTGGGSLLLKKAIQKRLSHAEISETATFDNAKGFYNVGVSLWE